MKIHVTIYFVGFIILTMMMGCKKEATIIPPSGQIHLKDTMIVLLRQDTTPVRISFVAGTYMDFTFISNVYENRCINCFAIGKSNCPQRGTADVDFQVKNESGDIYTESPTFQDCIHQYDTAYGSQGLVGWIPFHGHYKISPIRLDPYPTSLKMDSPYRLTLWIRQI